MYEDDLQLGKLKENCLLLKLYRKLRKMFLSPRRKSNPQPSDLRWDTILYFTLGNWHNNVRRKRSASVYHRSLEPTSWGVSVSDGQWLHSTRMGFAFNEVDICSFMSLYVPSLSIWIRSCRQVWALFARALRNRILFVRNLILVSVIISHNTRQVYTLENAHGQYVRDVDFNPNKQYYLVTCGDDCKVKFWDTRNPNESIMILSDHSHW